MSDPIGFPKVSSSDAKSKHSCTSEQPKELNSIFLENSSIPSFIDSLMYDGNNLFRSASVYLPFVITSTLPISVDFTLFL